MFCDICDQEYEAFTRAFEATPWIDGRNHDEICHCCMSIPKMWELIDEEIVIHEEFNPKRLHTLEEMVAYGFDKPRVQVSLRAVRKAIRNKKRPARKKS